MATNVTGQPRRRSLTPLWIISLFVALTETTLGITVSQTTGSVQVTLTAFVIIFPLLVAGAFFAILWDRPWVFYSPEEYRRVDVQKYVSALTQTRFTKITTKTADLKDEVKVVGNPDHFQLLFKATGSIWKKSTKAMEVENGCIVQVTTEQLNPDGSLSVA